MPKGTVIGIKGKRGFPVTKRAIEKKKGRTSKRNKFVHELIEEVVGVAPYEARLMDLIDLSEKRAQRFAKKRLGNLKRAKSKLKDVENIKRRIRRREQELAEKKKE